MTTPLARPEPDPLKRICFVCGKPGADRWSGCDGWTMTEGGMQNMGPDYAHTECDAEDHWFTLREEDFR